MKVAILGESEVDEVAVRILVDGVLEIQTQESSYQHLRKRGWPAVLQVIKPVILHLHYRSDADAFVVVVDSDHTPVHSKSHEEEPDPECRLCQVRQRIAEVKSSLRPRQGLPSIKSAVGLAVPALEAWLLFGSDPHFTEATWIQEMQAGKFSVDRKNLKSKAYGSAFTSTEQRKQVAERESRKLVDRLEDFEAAFPNGFGSLVRDIRSW